MADELHPGLHRILRDHGGDLLDTLRALSAPDLTTLLLAVADGRAGRRTASDLLVQYERDRFTAPGSVDPRALRAVTEIALDTVAGFDEVAPSPLAPLGLHAVLGGISQNRVVTTMRATEVAADPTNALALEAAVRRRATDDEVRLKAVQRVTRAQAVGGEATFAHFTLLGLVTAARDRGNHDVEVEAVVDHIRQHAAVAAALGLPRCRVAVTEFGGGRRATDRVLAALDATPGIDAGEDPDREAGTGYYPSLCFKLHVVTAGGEELEVADGGIVDWTQQLLQNRKERLMISGAGLDRLTLARTAPPADDG